MPHMPWKPELLNIHFNLQEILQIRSSWVGQNPNKIFVNIRPKINNRCCTLICVRSQSISGIFHNNGWRHCAFLYRNRLHVCIPYICGQLFRTCFRPWLHEGRVTLVLGLTIFVGVPRRKKTKDLALLALGTPYLHVNRAFVWFFFQTSFVFLFVMYM
jgi:hypothetical protein